MLAEGFGLKLPPHGHGVVEPAGGQHHAPPRGDGNFTPVVPDHRAGDPGALRRQATQRGVGPYRDSRAEHTGE